MRASGFLCGGGLGLPALAALLAAAAPAAAQEGGRALVIVPTFSTSLNYTNNRDLSSTDPKSDLIVQVSPGLHLVSNSGPLQGTLDYQLTGVFNARSSASNEVRNQLSASLLLLPLDSGFSVAARAAVSQQTISAFGTQGTDTGLKNSNTTEVASFGIAPTFRGSIAGLVDYNLSLAHDVTHAASTDASDVANTSAALHLGGAGGQFGWGLDGVRQIVDYSVGLRTVDDRGYATLLYFPDPEFRLSLRGGVDYSDALGNGRERTKTYGAGISWQPDVRTSLSFDRDRRYFGDSHSFVFQHRMSRSFWRYSDSRDVSSSTGTLPGLTAYELFSALFASEPDLIKRDALVRSFLEKAGIDPGVIATSGFLTSSRSVNRRRDASFALTGVRSSVTFGAYYTESQRLEAIDGVAAGTPDDFRVRQLGYSVALSHRLTPNDSLTLTGTRQKTLDAGSLLGNEQRSISLGWTTRPGPRTAISLAGRHVTSDGANPYTESGFNASLSLTF